MTALHAVLAIAGTAIVSLILGWSASTFNFLHSRSLYDAEAEKAELFAADVAQKVADKLKQAGK